MFTGLIEDLGQVAGTDATDDGLRVTIATRLAGELSTGDSIAVNGVCLTATEVTGEAFRADVMQETLRRTSLGAAVEHGRVNLERPLAVGDRLDGHMVQGHVDGLGEVRSIEAEGFARVVTIAANPSLLRYVVEKGSIAIDGISLTVVRVEDDALAVSLIPETLERTTLGAAEPGTRVNLEVDVLAKYVEKLVQR